MLFFLFNDAQSAEPFYPPNMKSISLGILLELAIRKYAKLFLTLELSVYKRGK